MHRNSWARSWRDLVCVLSDSGLSVFCLVPCLEVYKVRKVVLGSVGRKVALQRLSLQCLGWCKQGQFWDGEFFGVLCLIFSRWYWFSAGGDNGGELGVEWWAGAGSFVTSGVFNSGFDLEAWWENLKKILRVHGFDEGYTGLLSTVHQSAILMWWIQW